MFRDSINQPMKKIIFTLFLLLSGLSVSAFEVDGITYSVKDGENVMVTYSSTGYAGDIVIPSTVEYKGTVYKVTEIASNAFYLSKITSIIIPDGVKSIGYEAFQYCYDLKSVTMPNSVTKIEYRAFEDCTSLNSINLSEGLSVLAESLLSGCTSLKSVVVPNSVTEIRALAFYKCTALERVTLPVGLTSIAMRCFDSCFKLASIDISATVTSIGSSAFNDCACLTEVKIPSVVTSIGAYAFYGCKGLTSLKIPSGVTSIDEFTFAYCDKLETITLGSEINQMGFDCFYYSNNLKTINSLNATPSSCRSETFSTLNFTDCHVYVPQASVDAYKADAYWGQFKNIHGLTPEEVETLSVGSVMSDGMSDIISLGKGRLTITKDGIRVQVYDLSGKIFTDTSCRGSFTLPSGVYVIKAGSKMMKVKL